MRLAIAVLATLVAAGCGSVVNKRSAPPAATGVRAFVAALRSDNPRPAYDMLAEETRSTVPFDDFAVMWKQSGPERKFQADALEEGLKGDPDLGERSRVEYADGKTVYLVRESGTWRLESALVSRYHSANPRDAIQIFAEGIAARDYEGVMRILTSGRRSGIRSQVDAFATSLLQHLDDEITLIGKEKAVLRWEDEETRYRIVLRKEGDEWRVDDIHIRAAPPSKKK